MTREEIEKLFDESLLKFVNTNTSQEGCVGVTIDAIGLRESWVEMYLALEQRDCNCSNSIGEMQTQGPDTICGRCLALAKANKTLGLEDVGD